jgi:predicted nucleic acid-binding protein
MKRRRNFFIISILFGVLYVQAQTDVKLHITDGIADTVIKAAIESNSSLLLTEMGKAFIEERTPDFTGIAISPEASKTIVSIWNHTSMMSCSVSELNRKCIIRYDGGYQIRDIPVIMLNENIADADRKQEVCINYTSQGVIDEIFISNDIHRISSFVTEGMEVQEGRRRQRILDFVEQFRTAYNTKDLEFLKMVYSDNALIITGKVVKVMANVEKRIQVPEEHIVYTVQTKEEYLRKMKYIFINNRYINLEFSEVEIQQHPKYPEIYGVVFKQYWNVSTYNDTGYVFLMIDFIDENNPVIHIRTWQPQRYNKQDLKREEVFGVTSFVVNRGE